MRYVILLLASLALVGCSSARTALNTLEAATQTSVSPEAVIIAASSFDVMEITATNYLRLRRCTGTNGPLCRDPVITPTIIMAVRTGRNARNDLKKFARSHPGQLGPQGTYDALVTATNTLKSALNTYQTAAR